MVRVVPKFFSSHTHHSVPKILAPFFLKQHSKVFFTAMRGEMPFHCFTQWPVAKPGSWIRDWCKRANLTNKKISFRPVAGFPMPNMKDLRVYTSFQNMMYSIKHRCIRMYVIFDPVPDPGKVALFSFIGQFTSRPLCKVPWLGLIVSFFSFVRPRRPHAAAHRLMTRLHLVRDLSTQRMPILPFSYADRVAQ